MCGIVGYAGARDALPILLDGLRRLEYRGYDSAGIALVGDDGAIAVRKAEGKLSALEALLADGPPAGAPGIGHTRWATHGAPTTRNAHPHRDASGRIVVVHNGIFENHAELKAELLEGGHAFDSDTDTEVAAHLIGALYAADRVARPGAPAAEAFAAAVRRALARMHGSYALVALCAEVPEVVVAARHFSPLVVGLGDGETFVASDIPALLPHTRRVLLLEDGEVAVLTRAGASIVDAGGAPIDRAPFEVTWDAASAEKGGYPTFVRKEIDEQPDAVAAALAGRLADAGPVLPELDALGLDRIARATIVAAGTSFYAGLYGKRLLERWARLPVDVAIASELRYAEPVLGPDVLVVLISQSGETADTLAAGRLAVEAGAPTLALTNVVGSSLARLADATLHLQVGPEIGVVATKTFTGQLALLALVAADAGRRRGRLDAVALAAIARDLRAVPGAMRAALAREDEVAEVARRHADARSMFFIGRGFGHVAALEAALKLKEISYVHAEGYAAGELKHGPIAMLEPGLPVFAVATPSPTYEKVLSNLQEVRARGARIVAVAAEGDARIGELAEDVLRVPAVPDVVSPLVAAVPAQLFAYHVALERGCDIDQPRNLAKSVTVE